MRATRTKKKSSTVTCEYMSNRTALSSVWAKKDANIVILMGDSTHIVALRPLGRITSSSSFIHSRLGHHASWYTAIAQLAPPPKSKKKLLTSTEYVYRDELNCVPSSWIGHATSRPHQHSACSIPTIGSKCKVVPVWSSPCFMKGPQLLVKIAGNQREGAI